MGDLARFLSRPPVPVMRRWFQARRYLNSTETRSPAADTSAEGLYRHCLVPGTWERSACGGLGRPGTVHSGYTDN